MVSPCVRARPSYHAVQGRGDELRVHVGEAFELALVDVGDDQLVGGRQHGLRAREELVEVFCSFAALQESFRDFRHEAKGSGGGDGCKAAAERPRPSRRARTLCTARFPPNGAATPHKAL